MSEKISYPALTVINLAGEGASSTEPYRNVVINRVNESCLRLAAFEVEYRWHLHPNSDELFIVVDGTLEIDFVDAATLHLKTWDMRGFKSRHADSRDYVRTVRLAPRESSCPRRGSGTTWCRKTP